MTNTTDPDSGVDGRGIDDQPLAVDGPTSDLDYVLIENEAAPNECALYPMGATEEELLTRWITAHDDAFVDLESMR